MFPFQAQYSGAEQELLAKKQKLYAAQKQLNNLTNTINTYTSEKTTCEHWYDADCKAHNAWLDTKIAALWTEKHTESGVLDLAEDAVGAAEKVVNETSKLAANLHPEWVAPAPGWVVERDDLCQCCVWISCVQGVEA